jgi:hypothetical protein
MLTERRDFEAIDRLPTLDKLVLGTRLVGGPAYERGEGDGQTIGQLFALRNKLVHPRPGIGRFPRGAEWPRPDPTFNGPTAAGYGIAVARVGLNLIQIAFPHPNYVETPAVEIVRGETYLRKLAERASSPPTPAEDPLPDLVDELRALRRRR